MGSGINNLLTGNVEKGIVGFSGTFKEKAMLNESLSAQ